MDSLAGKHEALLSTVRTTQAIRAWSRHPAQDHLKTHAVQRRHGGQEKAKLPEDKMAGQHKGMDNISTGPATHSRGYARLSYLLSLLPPLHISLPLSPSSLPLSPSTSPSLSHSVSVYVRLSVSLACVLVCVRV